MDDARLVVARYCPRIADARVTRYTVNLVTSVTYELTTTTGRAEASAIAATLADELSLALAPPVGEVALRGGGLWRGFEILELLAIVPIGAVGPFVAPPTWAAVVAGYLVLRSVLDVLVAGARDERRAGDAFRGAVQAGGGGSTTGPSSRRGVEPDVVSLAVDEDGDEAVRGNRRLR